MKKYIIFSPYYDGVGIFIGEYNNEDEAIEEYENNYGPLIVMELNDFEEKYKKARNTK